MTASTWRCINTDGETIGRLGPTGYRAYSEAERGVLRRAMAAAANLSDRGQRPAVWPRPRRW